MARQTEASLQAQLPLAKALEDEVKAWSDQGWPGVTQTTYELLNYWFSRDEESEERFYPCQRRAIETIIYCHEVLQIRMLPELYERLTPEALAGSLSLANEVKGIPFPKYCLKMATGSGKTWVLAALLIWQYFNKFRGEMAHPYSNRFLVVVPGLEVLNRLLDSFKGKRDPRDQSNNPRRLPDKSDYQRNLFMPDGGQWRGQFHLEILEPRDVRANMAPPEGGFVFLTNWQQFRLRTDAAPLWEQYTGEDVEEAPRGEIIADFLAELPDLVVMNDEAHHVHGKKTKNDEELVWRRFMNVLRERLMQTHGQNTGLFMQIDYSATPFYGSGKHREHFPHIVYDFDLVEAMRPPDILVKQIFLEERQAIGGERLEGLDFRAKREPVSGRRLGEIVDLSAGQKLLLEIGRRKLEQLAAEFSERKLNRKPVMLVLCEETKVADRVAEHLAMLSDEQGHLYDESRVLVIHSEMPEAKLEECRKRLDKIDVDDDPLKIVVSVLMLREGFDKTNICVTVVLRASEADLLLEQIVGRGLRLMFPRPHYPELWEAKLEAASDIRRGKRPSNSLDFLFVVEHPRFRAFYEELRRAGYAIGGGDTSTTVSTGDVIPVEALPDRLPEKDLAWPLQTYEAGKLPDLSQIDLTTLPRYPSAFAQLKQLIGKLAVTDTFVETGGRVKTWKLDNEYFDCNHFLRQVSRAVVTEGRWTNLTGKQSEIAALIDEYVCGHMFGERIDFDQAENYQVLNYIEVFDHAVRTFKATIGELLGQIQYETRGQWRRLSETARIFVRESRCVETRKCIYPKLGYASTGGNFERDFMLEVLNSSAEVLAYAKLVEHKHKLIIEYRDALGVARPYHVDFIVKTQKRMYLVETKGDDWLKFDSTPLKARAAQAWCQTASAVVPPSGIEQPQEWEYLIISENLFEQNRRLGFDGFIQMARVLRDQLIAGAEGRLF